MKKLRNLGSSMKRALFILLFLFTLLPKFGGTKSEYFGTRFFPVRKKCLDIPDVRAEKPRKLTDRLKKSSIRMRAGWNTGIFTGTALYYSTTGYGLVPALLYDYCHRGDDAGNMPRKISIRKCFDQNLVSNDSIEKLLSSFITGDAYCVPEPLLFLMDNLKGPPGIDNVVRWIPAHMIKVLTKFAAFTSSPLQTPLKQILFGFDELFRRFRLAKDNSGEAWEALFVVALLMRVASYTFDEHIFPRPLDFPDQYSYSYNKLFCKVPNGKPLEEVHNLEEYISCFKIPDNVPHIAVYYPQHSNFDTYDVTVAAYDEYRNRVLYGYQLKEGAKLPAGTVAPSEKFKHSVWVRGQAAKIGSSSDAAWKVPSTGDIETFFGESGRHWTPAAWNKLSNSESSTNSPCNSTG
jgi:hypothetical protein